MSASIALEADLFHDGTSKLTRTYRARKVLGLWWSREAVTRTSTAMFGAWGGLVDEERRNRAPSAECASIQQ